MNSTCDMLTHKLSLTLSSSDVLVICIITFLIVFDICIARILSELSFFLVYARHTRMHGVSAQTGFPRTLT